MCIKRDLEVLCFLEVQVCTNGSTSAHVASAGLVLFGGISKHWMCMCAHSSIVSLDLSH